jgi:enterochelin esterase-like enzyme
VRVALRHLLALVALGIATAAGAADPLPAVASGRIERLQMQSTHVAPRNVDVWLPEGYPDAGPYAVLYLNDGQMLFDATHTWNRQEWRVDETASSLIAAGAVRPFIVVGIWNAGERRHAEYFPQRAFDALPASMREMAQAQAREQGQPAPVLSDAYLRFIVEELKPLIDSRFAVQRGAADTFIGGSSMGGLISMYAVAEYPAVFGGCACMSTHWPGVDASDDNPVAAALIAYVADRFPAAGIHRVWFDHGTATLDAAYPALQRDVDAHLHTKGYTGADWQTRVFDGAEHSEAAWAERLHLPLRFLLGAPGASVP